MSQQFHVPATGIEPRLVLYTNHAIASLQLASTTGDAQAASDCLKALELDATSVKAMVRMGAAQTQMGNVEAAVKHWPC